jgi:4-azaleucine resistance transporter AzlC
MRPEESGAWREFRQGTVAVFPVVAACVPIGVVWGALAAERGLSLAEIWLMSAAVFAGASQFVAIGMWTTPLPIAAIVFATAMVNLRHMMMSASLQRRMERFSAAQRYLAYGWLTDEAWALAEARAAREPLTPAYYAGLAGPLFAVWPLASLAGGAFGKVMGDPAAFGLDFVFTALFIGLIVGFRSAPSWLPVVLASAAMALITYHLLPPPWYVIAGGLAGVAVAALQAPAARIDPLEVRPWK